MRKYRNLIRSFILFQIVISLVIGVFLFFYINNRIDLNIEEMKINEQASLKIVKNYIEDTLTQVFADLSYTNDIVSHHLGMPEIDRFENLKNNLIYFSARKNIYDQIRYLDENGNEIIRINRNNYGAESVPDEYLQNKKHRYYFTSSVNLEKGMVYISPLDLNLENKKIEIPYKPMLRFATPVYDKENNSRGVVIFNYLARYILDNLPEFGNERSGCSHILLNKDGYWLYCNQNSDLPFRFMFPDQEQITFYDRFPDAAVDVFSGDSGIFTSDSEIILWETVYPEYVAQGFSYIPVNRIVKEDEDDLWKQVSIINQDQLDNIRQNINNEVLKYAPYLLLISLVISFTISFLLYRNRVYQDHIKHLAHYDALTEISNRQFFLEMAAKSLELSARKKELSTILFLDLDGFKPINDNYGHEAGDFVLINVANRLKSRLRKSDLVARYGGDEFIVLLQGVKSKDNVEFIIEKIRVEIEKNMVFQGETLMVGTSIGAAFYPEDSESIEGLIELADTSMYKEKRIRKKQRSS